MPQLVVPSSESQYGYVVGQVIRRIADTIDNDDKPDIIPATGSVSFTPKRGLGRTTNYSAFLLDETIVCPLDEMGRLIRRRKEQTEDLEPGVFLAAGEYSVSFNVGAPIPGFDIQVTTAHTVLAPLDLVKAAPYTPPAGTVVQTMPVPAGAAVGQVLSWTPTGLGWVDMASGAYLVPDPTHDGLYTIGTLTSGAYLVPDPTHDGLYTIGTLTSGAYLVPDPTHDGLYTIGTLT